MADQMISSDETSFVVGEQVLCYDPNPGNLQLLYESKILKIRPEKDEQGRDSPGYLVHFQGWKSTRDQYVSAEYLLKDNDKNRTLQKTMAEEAGMTAHGDGNAYRKGQKIRAKSNPKPLASEADENDLIRLPCRSNVVCRSPQSPIMADQMISSDETSFIVGEQVLCYDPNPGNLLLLYKSKILKIRPEKDEQGRDSPGYLVRFLGWKSTRDRYVSAEYLLKDNDENRTLQKTMAEEAGMMAHGDGNAYRKAQKISAKSNPKPLASEADENSVDEEETTADRNIEPRPSGTSELAKRGLPADGNAYRKAQKISAKSNPKPLASEADENSVDEEATADRNIEPRPSGTSELAKRGLPADGNAYRKAQKISAKSNPKPLASEADENSVDEEEATADRNIEPRPSGTSELAKRGLPADGNVYRKAQKIRAKSNPKPLASEADENSVDEEEATAYSNIEPRPSGTSELAKRGLPDLVFPEYLKILIENSNCSVLRNDLVRLPGRPNVVTLLESFLKYSARINFNEIYIIKKHKAYAPKLIDKHEIERRFNLCVEVLENLRIWFNKYLEVELLFNDIEKLQYNEAIKMTLQQPVNNEKQDYLSNSNCTLEQMFKEKITLDKYIISKADAWKAVPDSAYNENIKEPAIVYGVYHLLRLLDVLPKILAQTNLQGEKLSTVYFYCNKLLRYIIRQSHQLF